jgi:hypothetical protein
VEKVGSPKIVCRMPVVDSPRRMWFKLDGVGDIPTPKGGLGGYPEKIHTLQPDAHRQIVSTLPRGNEWI